MDISARKEKNILVVGLKGRLDAVTAPEFDKKLTEFISQGENSLILNFSGVEYISSAGLRSILASSKMLKSKEGRSVITGLQGSVKDVFKMSGFYSILEISDSEQAAIDLLK